ncbi:MAG: MerR family transcriptional regulator [Polyangiales bacterium]
MTTYTVGEVARIARISVRTLHHYDEIGLVEPSGRSAAGYRLYTDADLDRLQQVLFFRELELRLDDIVAILADPGFDRKKALIAQRALLEQKLEKTRATLALVEKTIRALDGELVMTKEEMFETEAQERWGHTESYRISKQRTAKYRKEDWDRIKAEQAAILDAFAALAEAGVEPTHGRAMDVAERHRAFIDETFYPCSRAMHTALGQMYVDDPRFAEHYESKRAGLAEYVRDAIAANAKR